MEWSGVSESKARKGGSRRGGSWIIKRVGSSSHNWMTLYSHGCCHKVPRDEMGTFFTTMRQFSRRKKVPLSLFSPLCACFFPRTET